MRNQTAWSNLLVFLLSKHRTHTHKHRHTGTLKETCKCVQPFGTLHFFYYSLFTFSQALKCLLNKGKMFIGSYFVTRPAIMLYHLWEGSVVNAVNYMTLCWDWVAAWGGGQRSKTLRRVMVMMLVMVMVIRIMNGVAVVAKLILKKYYCDVMMDIMMKMWQWWW